MSVYKVPQDVEAEDKLLGPFSFRQFIYIIIAMMGVALGWGLSKILLPLAVLPLPIVVFFGALALPLKKDQPMEIYLAAILSFYLKPRKRLWKADGMQSLIEIVEPKTTDELRTKDLDQDEAARRLSYLANLVDSRGWAVRGVSGVPQADNAMQDDVFFEAQQTNDILDDNNSLTHTLDTMIDRADAKRRQDAMSLMSRSAAATEIPPTPDPYAALSAPSFQAAPVPTSSNPEPHVTYNPYPEAIHQAVVAPIQSTVTTSQPTVSADIINLVNTDLSVATIEHEAKRLREKEELASSRGEEVVIPLR